MFKSIRWTLQLWQACILLLALGSFGTMLYVAASRTTDTELNAALLSAGRVFAVPAEPPPSAVGNSSGPQIALVSPSSVWNSSSTTGRAAAYTAIDQHRLSAWLGGIPLDCLQRLGWDPRDQPYFIVWAVDGSILRASPAHPILARPTLSPADPSAQFRQRDGVREVLMPGPGGSLIEVGRSVRREQASLAQLRYSIIGAGVLLLALGSLGGMVLAGRALRPIRRISDAAQSISVSDLSQRIQIDQTKSELGSLAHTLNDMFDRLEAAFVRQARFTADASHELRTPLSVIHASSQLALARLRSPEEYRQTIESSLRASKRMNSLVESLLVLSRADTDGLELQYQCFDLRQIAQECVTLLLPIARQRDVKVELRGEPLRLHADKERIMQLITNLLTNSIQYNRRGGTVCIAIADEQGYGMLEVSDTGIGIAPADQSNIFQRFFRVDKARLRDSGGCGLGLAICKSIVTAHGGCISFRSQPELGTTFQVKLPLSPPGGNGSPV